jgi:hypothetical protein
VISHEILGFTDQMDVKEIRGYEPDLDDRPVHRSA